jgi:L-alanine-DL-glutamate epimerase-like enolase superfamily enzyme
MKITAVETYWTRIPFDMGGKPATTGGLNWQTMNTVWLRVVTDQGLEGWGEAFGHASAATTMAVLNTQFAPAVLGQDARDIGGLRARLSKAFHGFGRNGSHVFALSASTSRCGTLPARQPAWPCGGCSARRRWRS